MNKDLTLKRQLGYIEELKRCANEDCDFYLEHNEAYEFYNYIKDLQNNWNELKNRTQKKIEQLDYFNKQLKTSPYTPQIETLKLTLKDMQELEGNNE